MQEHCIDHRCQVDNAEESDPDCWRTISCLTNGVRLITLREILSWTTGENTGLNPKCQDYDVEENSEPDHRKTPNCLNHRCQVDSIKENSDPDCWNDNTCLS